MFHYGGNSQETELDFLDSSLSGCRYCEEMMAQINWIAIIVLLRGQNPK